MITIQVVVLDDRNMILEWKKYTNAKSNIAQMQKFVNLNLVRKNVKRIDITKWDT